MAQRHKFDLILSQLRGAGWRVFTEPILRIVDDEWVLRRVDDRLDYLFISESDLKWERKRFTRERGLHKRIPAQRLGSGN
jgi:hypothetical protein